MSLRFIVLSMGISNVFSEAIVLLFVMELIRFHILIIDSIFNMFIMVLGDDFLFCISWANALWSRCCLRSLDAFGIIFLSSSCASWILCLMSFIVVQVVSIIGVTFFCNFFICFFFVSCFELGEDCLPYCYLSYRSVKCW